MVQYEKGNKRGMDMQKIMIVEDDAVIQKAISDMLEKWGFEVFGVKNFHQVMEDFLQKQPHLVILDITLPFYNGYYWCQEIRKLSNVPILFLSSHDEPVDIVMSMNMGADDFMTKPFDMKILVAKIQSLLRRSYEFVQTMDYLEYKEVYLHLHTAHLSYKGQQITLTKNEFLIAQVLFQRKGSFVSREEFMRELWETEWFVDDNTLSVNVARLRKKLEELGLENMIVTKKRIGYGLVDGE